MNRVLLAIELGFSLAFMLLALTLPGWSKFVRAPLHFEAAGIPSNLNVDATELAESGKSAPSPLLAFTHGSIGTELMPSAVARVLFDMDGVAELFHPRGVEQGAWDRQFGFINLPSPEVGRQPRLPLGFVESYRTPGNGQPTFVPYLGFSCALCHSNQIVKPGGEAGPVILGAGNATVDVAAFFEAFRSSLLKQQVATDGKKVYTVTYDTIAKAWEKNGVPTTFIERQMTRLWLATIRKTLTGATKKYDLGYEAAWLTDPHFLRQGPGRTHPFGTLATSILELPTKSRLSSKQSFGYSKIPAVLGQANRKSAQFDGTVANSDARSMLAAFTVGATVANLGRPDIYKNISLTSEYTRTLQAPSLVAVFQVDLQQPLVTRGKVVYETPGANGLSCFDCHGRPRVGEHYMGTSSWEDGKLQGMLVWPGGIRSVPQQDEIRFVKDVALGVDNERVTFRHGDGYMGDDLFSRFSLHRGGHPLVRKSGFARQDIGNSVGYVNAPLESLWLRAPFLHNASIPTLRQFLNLDARPQKFWRGRDAYDPAAVGLTCPDGLAAAPADDYWLFDTTEPGNSNLGHDYPWPRDTVISDPSKQKDLEALLEYLKTF